MDYSLIKKDMQIKKFSAYGLLKNLKFFEPYLIIYLVSSGYTLFQVGLLISIREFVMYVFEIPSGIIADAYGRKKELYLCFIFYIISFILFYLASNFMLIVIAMTFFGLGEAFRSGTHKAMIYTYLEEKGWETEKAFVYGRTRSFSLIGSAISSLLAIVLILNVPSTRYIFLVSTLPYLLDLLLIMTYPQSLNGEIIKDEKFVNIAKKYIASIFKNKLLVKVIVSSSSFEAIFKSAKDYIQPILETVIIASGFAIANQTSDDSLKIVLGLSYGFIFLLSSLASRRAYLLKNFASSEKLMNIFNLSLAMAFALLAWFIKIHLTGMIILMFLVIYMLKDLRKPIFVDVVDVYMDKQHRATVMSIESQIKALIIILVSPFIGWIADFNLSIAMGVLSLMMFFIYGLTYLKENRQ